MKTIEDAALIHQDTYCDDPHGIGYDAFVAGAEFAQRWIPIEEELPDNSEWVLVKSKKNNITTGTYDINVGWISSFNSEDITHWRPIELK